MPKGHHGVGGYIGASGTYTSGGRFDLKDQQFLTSSNLWTPTIPTSGLLFQLDASLTSSYPGSGTTWTDISGNGRNGTINNTSAVTFVAASGGQPAYFNFAGGADTAYIYQTAGTTSNVYDVVIGLQVSPTTNVLGGIFLPTQTLGGDKSLRLSGATISTTWGIRGPAGSAQPTDANDWQNGQETYSTINNNTSIASPNTYAVNTWGILRSYSTNSNFTRPMSWQIGAGAYTGRWFIGKINFMLGYSRQLSTAEVTQIYNAYRGRYGI